MTASPNGCRHCGIAEREHFSRWKPGPGWHVWTAPTDEQIKARMIGRRNNRPTT